MHPLFQVQPDDPHRISLQFLQIIIHGKGEVGLAASKINNGGLPVRSSLGRISSINSRKRFICLYLSYLVHHPALFCHDAQIHQKGNREFPPPGCNAFSGYGQAKQRSGSRKPGFLAGKSWPAADSASPSQSPFPSCSPRIRAFPRPDATLPGGRIRPEAQ